MSFTTILDLFKGIFSRAFWFGSFLPLATFAAANLAFMAVVFPGSVVRDQWTDFKEGPLTNATLAFVGLVVLAYAISPLLPLFRGIFDGRFLPAWLQEVLLSDRRAAATRIKARLGEAKDRLTGADLLAQHALRELVAARAVGKAAGAPDPKQAAAAAKAVDALNETMSRGRMPKLDELKAAVAVLKAVLETGHTAELDRVHKSLLDKLQVAARGARSEYETLLARDYGIDVENPQATRIGDARVIVQGYTREMYGVDFAYIWPRMQLAIPNDDPLLTRIDMAEGQVNFSVLSLVLSILTAAVWPPLLIAVHASIWPYLAFCLVAPLSIALFYRLLFESQLALGDVVELTIDSARLTLLTTVMRQPMPATLSAERRLWKTLSQSAVSGTGIDLIYRHPPPPSGAAS